MAINVILQEAPTGSTIFNSTSAYTQNVFTGYNLTLPDTPIFSTLSGYTNTTPSVSTGFTIPDVVYTDSDGSTGNTAEYGTTIVCTPIAVESVALNVSDTTPDYGDSITLTATSTNFTPTSYTFYVPITFGGYSAVTQTSSTYTWNVNFIGTGSTFVTATDNSNIISSSATTIVVDGLPLDYIQSNISSACALKQLTVAYTGDVVNIRRSSDSATSGFTATELIDGTAVTWVGSGNTGYTATIFDQSGNNRYMFQQNASYQGIIIESGAVITDSAGNPAYRNQLNNQAMKLVGVRVNDTNNMVMLRSEVSGINGAQAWVYTQAGNPSVGTYTTNPASTANATTNAGTPTYYGNGFVIANQRGPLGAHIIGNLAITTVIDANFSGPWRSADITTYLLFADTSSKFTFGILSNQFDSSERALLEEKMNDLYGYY